MSARITFYRGGGWMDRFRAYTLSVSGETVGTIKRNSRLSVEVEAKPHMVMARIDWCSSDYLFVDLQDGGEAHIEVSNPHNPWKGASVTRKNPINYLVLRLRDA